MRIISWNVNGIRAVCEKNFLPWLGRESPDILCVQETKAEPGQLSDTIKMPYDGKGARYLSFWASAKKRGYSGVAIFTKEKPTDVTTLGIPDFDNEGRTLIARYEKFILVSAYFPNSQEAGARLNYKLAFCDAILKFCKKTVKDNTDILVCGDYNIAHKPIDLSRPKENEGNPGYLPEERAWMDAFTGEGFTDTFRAVRGDITEKYSWWSYRMRARERNIGWRIDYNCANDSFMPHIKDASILSDISGSDHCPISIDVEI